MPKRKIQDNIHLRLGELARPLERFRKALGFETPQDAIRDILRDRFRQEKASRRNRRRNEIQPQG
ncbi:MAG TPA: hypothetical protein VID27_06090 [Blastocatellia bacterium]